MSEETCNPFQQINDRLAAIEEEIRLLRESLNKTGRPENKFYSVDWAAHRLNVAPVTIYRNIEKGQIESKYVKRIGTRIMISSEYFT